MLNIVVGGMWRYTVLNKEMREGLATGQGLKTDMEEGDGGVGVPCR